MNEIKVPFGRAVDGQMIHIDAITVRGLACECFCPECSTPLVAVKGEIKRAHFRHYVDPASCRHARETALHLYAKQIICERLELALPVHSGFPYNLGRMESAEAEVRVDNIIPDVLAKYPDETVAIEIWVRHQVPREKIAVYDARKLAALEIDLSAYRWADRDEADWRNAILYVAPRQWLLPPLAVRLEYERRDAELAAQRKREIEEAEAARQAAEAKRIVEEQEWERLLQQEVEEDKERKQAREVERAILYERARQIELERQQEIAKAEAEKARTRAVKAARRRQLEREKRGPDLQELVRAHGGYSKITPEAWAAYDHEMTEWKTRVKFGDFRQGEFRELL